jgi:RNA polymerase sigma factor for flagellar operon FliA
LKTTLLPYQKQFDLANGSGPQDSSTICSEEAILRYTPLIKYIAYRLAMRLPPHIALGDLMSAGVIGLIDAFKKYDANKNVEFKTYAEFRIRGAMIDELRALDWVPRSVRQKTAQVEKAIANLEKERGRPVEDEEIARELNLPLEEYYDLMNRLKGISLLDIEGLRRAMSKVPEGDLLDYLQDDEENDPFHLLSVKELKRVLGHAIEELSPKEKTVISLYYYDELTLKEIGEVLELTESRVCQIHTKAILKLRTKLKRILKEML